MTTDTWNEKPWHRAEEDGNAQAWTYASAPDGPRLMTRGQMARWNRAEIAHWRSHQRPAHLPYFPQSWEDDFTPQPWEPKR